ELKDFHRPTLFAKKFKSYANNKLLLCSRNTVTTSRSRISIYLNEYAVVTVLRDAKMCSTSERYSKNIGAQRSPIEFRVVITNIFRENCALSGKSLIFVEVFKIVFYSSKLMFFRKSKPTIFTIKVQFMCLNIKYIF